ncbi:aminopeptidase (homolog to leucyl aminopeptidase / aminopeptidase T) [Natronomonas pharaonis DSM 2160]|uniref:Aminopeptidase (Homolog to leucyl aminopeptidase / aminopeptidase T) n=1 Tax=Natronomonas pharaonis (strain ATCC 35678 / DSM 2160 / CIP 103997 / JCM 8858 / NBRC 14720 / NCIMB 2260 / Gabara) TaxID=348780 RepID=A0A1U7EUL6_NATPD|nr:aminopeptidase [Natronomonas pharaonis]CAI48661.1 aminopeptidase (homolog to leucyl aminopeptidase / aminopeptidase T) [Natronomonas pharaonis DSM 2160]
MDERVREHAAVLVDWSARVDPGDDVVISVAEDAHELAVAVAERLGEVGANVVTTYGSAELQRAYLQAHDGDFEAGDHEAALLSAADVYLRLGGGRNTAATADVESETRQAYSRARANIRDARMDTDWVSTVHPTRSLAQQAGMAYEAYQEFVYNAVLRDWEALAERMATVKALLDDGERVRIVKERDDQPRTDIQLSIADRTAVNSAASVAYDSHNLPSGEVFTAPADADGEVFFDVPMTISDRRVRDVRLVFEAGEVVDYEAAQGESVIESVLETDAGARRLGELGIGMNRGIDRVTDNILFDEKMGETAHLALGRAYDANLPDGESGNDSAVHVDLITDLSEASRIEVDGDVVQRNGVFYFEDGFEAAKRPD